MLLCLSSAPAAVDTSLALSPRCGVGNVKSALDQGECGLRRSHSSQVEEQPSGEQT